MALVIKLETSLNLLSLYGYGLFIKKYLEQYHRKDKPSRFDGAPGGRFVPL